MCEETMPLTTLEVIRTRYSCRAFSDRMPSDEVLRTIAEAAVASPSARNIQPWRIVVIKSQALLAELEAEGMAVLAAQSDRSTYERIMSRGGKLYYGAPCMIIVPVPPAAPGSWEVFDCGIVSQTIALAAASLGVDSLICGMISLSFAGARSEAFKERLGFPEGHRAGIAVLLGYAAQPGGTPHVPNLSKISVVE